MTDFYCSDSHFQIRFYFDMKSLTPYKLASMNLVHTTQDGQELWLGDYYAASNHNLLKQKNIKAVLTAARGLNIIYTKQMQIVHKRINADDIQTYRMTPHFDEAFKFIDEGLKRGNVLVHCAAGISRSTTLVIVYLMRAEGMTFKQAMDFVRSKRSIICPNDGFQKELKRYEAVLSKMKKQQKVGNAVEGHQKQAVLDFLKQENKNTSNQEPKIKSLNKTNGQIPSKPTQKMNATMGSGQVFLGGSVIKPANNAKGLMRYKSLNYSSKNNANGNPAAQAIKKTNQNGDVQKLTKHFLDFKLQKPKIVTIKK